MLGKGFGILTMAVAGAFSAGAASAQSAVPETERLTVGDVFANAAPEVQIAFALLVFSTLAAVAVWAMSLPKVARADAKGLAGALGRLRIMRSGATPLGLLAASYTLFAGFLGVANARPAPSFTVLAPGLAEAALAVMLGLLATLVAVVCERHLEGRIRQAAA